MPKPKLSTEEIFEQIIQDAISEAESVDCPMEDFVEGLESMKMSLTARIECES